MITFMSSTPKFNIYYYNSIQSAIENLLAMCILHSTSITSSTVIVTDNTVKLGITLPKSIVQKIDKKRADIPRSRYIRRAIERYLGSSSSKDIEKTAKKKEIVKK
jgi:hypothetical protein